MNKYDAYPNIARVARELARCENPDKVLNAMLTMLAAIREPIKGDRA